MGVYIWNKLPSEYQEVEYIQSSGTQRIDTGINVSNDITYGFECKVNFSQISTGSHCIMDMGNSSTDTNRYGISYYYNGSVGEWQFGYTNPSSPYWGQRVSGYGPAIGTDFTLSYNLNGDKIGKINGTSVLTGMGISNISYTNNWNIFCQTYGSTYTRYGEFKLYYMKIYHGSTLVRDFIPCYRKSDNVIGLYDLVNSVFYTNSGSGTFTKGSDVNNYYEKNLKNAYIGEYVEETYTEAKFGNNTSGVIKTKSIYKPGYKVVKIEYNSTVSAGSNTTYGTATLGYRQNSNSARSGAYINYGGSIQASSCAYQLSGPDTIYKAPTSPEFGYTTVHVEITPEHIIISNGTGTINYTYNIPSASKSQIEALFSGTELEVFLRAIYPYLGPTTYTVTYEKI